MATPRLSTREETDLLVAGAGTAGLPLAMEAAARGLRVTLIEGSDRIGGALHVSAGQMSAAGTELQRSRGIHDTPDAHFEDVMRISRGTADAAMVRKAVELAPETIDWLMATGFEMDPACPAILHYHEAYRTPRTYWGIDGGRSVLAVLTRLFEARRSAIDLRFGTRLVDLLRDGDGRIAAARLAGADGTSFEIGVGAVALATGGYGANDALFRELTAGRPLYTAAPATSRGDGIALVRKLGGTLRGAEHYLPTFAGVEHAPGSGRVLWDELPALTPQSRLPWEIFVTRDGRRFVAEDSPSVDARERALLRTDDLTFWIVFDEAIRRAAPPLFPGWPAQRLADAYRGRHHAFHSAETLSGLAAAAGIDPAGLAATVGAYNEAVATAHDALGRRHLPAPIAVPPFHAVRCHGIVLRTAAGVVVDATLRVLDAAGAPIPNLYALGEVLGGGTLSGNSFVGGMSVTPALGFGRWLGRTIEI